MKELTIDEFKATSVDDLVWDVLAIGEIYRVDNGKAGAFIIMEEPEYKIMREALNIVFALAGAADKDGMIDLNDILKKAGI